ncbi:MAG: hypothetical protein AB3N22_21270 [Ruegeria sp.]
MSFWVDWSDGKKWFMGILAALLIILISWIGSQIHQSISTTSGGTSVLLISAQPNGTDLGGPQASVREVERILNEDVSRTLSETCFKGLRSKSLKGEFDVLISRGSNGFANNFSIRNTNIMDADCIEDVLRGTRFPEPVGVRPGDGYWVTGRIEVR